MALGRYRNMTAGLTVGTLALVGVVSAQTLIDLRTQTKNVDFSAAISTRPEKTGTVLPATCNPGELFFNTAAAAGANLIGCIAPNTWAVMGGGGSGVNGASGTGGLAICNASNTATPNALACNISGFTLAPGSTLILFVAAPTTSGTVTLVVNGGAPFAIFRGSGNSPSPGELAPNSTQLLLAFTGYSFQIVNDSYEPGGTNCVAISRTAFPWTIDIIPACVMELASPDIRSSYKDSPRTHAWLLPSPPPAATKFGLNTDAGGPGYGSWSPFGIGTSGSSFAYGAGGTTYFIEISGPPLITVNSVVMQDAGPGGIHFWAFALNKTDGAGGCDLVAHTGGLPFTTGSFDANSLLFAYQLQPAATYYAAWTSDVAGGTHAAVIGSQELFNPDNDSEGSSPFRYFTGNSTIWSGGSPSFPATCGTRSKYAGSIPLFTLRHK
jgi:hypothetical protein